MGSYRTDMDASLGFVLLFNFNKLHLSDFIVEVPVMGDAEKQRLWGHNSFVFF